VNSYSNRVIDGELDDLLPGLPAIAIDGPKGVGKTATAQQRAATMLALDEPSQRELLAADPQRLDRAETPVLIDEWQRLPLSWDLVRRSVDRNPAPGRFLLTGSAVPTDTPTHSGAGRIVQLRMRPMTLSERSVESPTVSVKSLLSDAISQIGGHTRIGLETYADEIVSSGFPAIRQLPARARRAQLDGYLARIVERDFAEQGVKIRRPATLRAWLTAYAAATSTTTSYNAILDAATAGEHDKPAKTTTMTYRDVLTQLWLLEPVPAWLPTTNPFTRLAQAPKHHLADPALAARLLGLDVPALLDVNGRPTGRRENQMGALFESLIALQLRVFGQSAEARLHHLRTRNGDHEVDFILERADHRALAIEVKLGSVVTDRDVSHLRWLKEQLGSDLIDAVVVNTGQDAYRRTDGIAVVPAALLGP
jgi:predicted AAA+ superfamily ATPase